MPLCTYSCGESEYFLKWQIEPEQKMLLKEFFMAYPYTCLKVFN